MENKQARRCCPGTSPPTPHNLKSHPNPQVHMSLATSLVESVLLPTPPPPRPHTHTCGHAPLQLVGGHIQQCECLVAAHVRGQGACGAGSSAGKVPPGRSPKKPQTARDVISTPSSSLLLLCLTEAGWRRLPCTCAMLGHAVNQQPRQYGAQQQSAPHSQSSSCSPTACEVTACRPQPLPNLTCQSVK